VATQPWRPDVKVGSNNYSLRKINDPGSDELDTTDQFQDRRVDSELMVDKCVIVVSDRVTEIT